MTSDFWTGVAVIPGFLVLAALLLVGIPLGALRLWHRFAPSHWYLSGLQRHARPAREVFRFTDVAGGHAESLRRLVRLGPWGVYVIRYAPGHADVPEPERIP